MNTNLHTHTARCHHAKGTDREYIEAAISAGIRELGFSDHMPFAFPDGHRSYFRVDVADAEDYIRSLRALRREYADRITIRIGFEMEYYPALFDQMLNYAMELGAEYLLLGQHFTKNESDGDYSGRPGDSVDKLDDYFGQCLEGMKTGYFSYLAHPDLVNFTGSSAIYTEKAQAFLQQLHQLGAAAEYNRLGFAERRNYPSDAFWRLAGKEGIETVIGLDAHAPEVFADAASVRSMQARLRRFGITPVEATARLL